METEVVGSGCFFSCSLKRETGPFALRYTRPAIHEDMDIEAGNGDGREWRSRRFPSQDKMQRQACPFASVELGDWGMFSSAFLRLGMRVEA